MPSSFVRPRVRAAKRPPALVPILAACFFPALAACSPEASRPNVIVITLDTTRADFLGCYGRPGNPTPNLDALAEDGTRFDLAIATASVTPVSHASILTGLDNDTHGLRVLSAGSGFRLGDDVPTLGTILKKEGYRTGAIHSAFPVSAHFGLQQGFDLFESFDPEPGAGQTTWNVLELQRRSDETTDLALDFTAEEERPFFLWIHYWDPHDGGLLPPPEALPANLPRNEKGELVMSRDLYAAEVSYLDRQIGRLLDGLRASGDYENTIVVVVADHGEGLGDHGWPFHRILYQEQIRVPLIVRVPHFDESVSRAASHAGLVSTIDIAPTVLDYLSIAPPRALDGRSLRPALEGRELPPRPVFADQINGYDHNAEMVKKRPQDDFLYAVIEMPWKLVYRPAHPAHSELYDLVADPRETKNLFASETARAQSLLVRLAEHDPWVTAPFPKLAGAGDSERASSALRGLGYTGDDDDAPAGDVGWSWTCPRHAEVVEAARGPCPTCKTPMIPVRGTR